MLGEAREFPIADHIRTICDELRGHCGERAHGVASRQMGIARGDSLAIWLAILRKLRDD